MRPLLAVAGWIAAAVAAILIGLAGVQAIGNGITDGAGNDVLSAERAARELAAAPPPSGPGRSEAPSAAPSQAPSPGPSSAPPSVNERVFSGDGGTVRAACLSAGAKLISSVPAQGYSVKETRPGPGAQVEVRFDRGSSGRGNGESRVRITCQGGFPVASWD